MYLMTNCNFQKNTGLIEKKKKKKSAFDKTYELLLGRATDPAAVKLDPDRTLEKPSDPELA